MEILIPIVMAGVGYVGTWIVDRRQRPSLVVGGGLGVLGTLITLFV